MSDQAHNAERNWGRMFLVMISLTFYGQNTKLSLLKWFPESPVVSVLSLWLCELILMQTQKMMDELEEERLWSFLPVFSQIMTFYLTVFSWHESWSPSNQMNQTTRWLANLVLNLGSFSLNFRGTSKRYWKPTQTMLASSKGDQPLPSKKKSKPWKFHITLAYQKTWKFLILNL